MSDPLALSVHDVEAMGEAEAQTVLSAWVKAKRAELPEALARSKNKPLARLAKRALYQLKSSGVAVEAPPTPQAEAPIEAHPEELPCVLSAILGTGERAVFFARRASGGLKAYQGILSDEGGILQLQGGPAKRSAYRKHLEALEADPELDVLLVDWPRMKLELGRALSLNDRGAPLPDETATLVRLLEVDPVDPDWALPPPEGDDDALAKGSAALHHERELAQWFPSQGAIAELGTRLADVDHSVLVLSEAQKRQQALGRVAALAASYLTPERRRIYARRLWAMAELFEKSDRPRQASLARAEARVLFHSAGPSAFIEAMFEKIVDRRSPDASPSPVTPPAPSGLVLP